MTAVPPIHFPITRCPNSTASAPTNTSSRLPTESAISFLGRRYPSGLGTQYLVPHAQLRASSRISGETDFPCIYGDKVGLGRVYVKMLPHDAFNYDSWILGVRDGRSYCGDGRSHVFDLKVNGVALGEPGSKGKTSQLDLDAPGKVKVTFDVAARLEENPTEETERIRHARLDQKPYWHIERARIGDSRKVPVELIVNGRPRPARNRGRRHDRPMTSKWNWQIPVGSPCEFSRRCTQIRFSSRSAESPSGPAVRVPMVRKAVDVCWHSKKGNIRSKEQPAAKAAYDAARDTITSGS